MMMNTRAQALEAALRELILAHELMAQPLRPEGRVTPKNPGGQLTAFLPNGAPVDRTVYLQQSLATARALLANTPPTPSYIHALAAAAARGE